MLRSSASRTSSMLGYEGRVKAYIYRRSASGIGHQGRRRVVRLVTIERAGVGAGGLVVYTTQCARRGAISPTYIRIVCVDSIVSIVVTTFLTNARQGQCP